MATRSLTIEIPEVLFDRLQQRAMRSQRSVQAEVLDALTTAVDDGDALPDDLAHELARLSLLDDPALWRTARMRLPAGAVHELESLHAKRGQAGLSPAEADRLTELLHEYDRIMLVRAQAAALLRSRGHDVQDLLRPA